MKKNIWIGIALLLLASCKNDSYKPVPPTAPSPLPQTSPEATGNGTQTSTTGTSFWESPLDRLGALALELDKELLPKSDMEAFRDEIYLDGSALKLEQISWCDLEMNRKFYELPKNYYRDDLDYVEVSNEICEKTRITKLSFQGKDTFSVVKTKIKSYYQMDYHKSRKKIFPANYNYTQLLDYSFDSNVVAEDISEIWEALSKQVTWRELRKNCKSCNEREEFNEEKVLKRISWGIETMKSSCEVLKPYETSDKDLLGRGEILALNLNQDRNRKDNKYVNEYILYNRTTKEFLGYDVEILNSNEKTFLSSPRAFEGRKSPFEGYRYISYKALLQPMTLLHGSRKEIKLIKNEKWTREIFQVNAALEDFASCMEEFDSGFEQSGVVKRLKGYLVDYPECKHTPFSEAWIRSSVGGIERGALKRKDPSIKSSQDKEEERKELESNTQFNFSCIQ